MPHMVRQGGDSASPSLPVWLGGFTTPALRRAVRSGDGFTVLGANREPYDRREWVLVSDTAIGMIRAFVDAGGAIVAVGRPGDAYPAPVAADCCATPANGDAQCR